jgi:hypothetical protein
MKDDGTQSWMNLTVAPWVGECYHDASPKILIVGHSTYIKDTHGRTPEEIREWLISDTMNVRNSTFTYKYWTNIMSAVTGSKESKDYRRKEFWDRVALYNYIQRIQTPGLHQATDDDYAYAYDKFKQLVTDLAPSHILVFSAQVFDYLDKRESQTHALRLSHPSWYFSWRRANEKIKLFLSK